MKLFSIVLASAFVLASVNADIMEAVMKNCEVKKSTARSLMARVSPFMKHSLEELSEEDLSRDDTKLIRSVLSVIPGSQNTVLGQLMENNFETPAAEKLLYNLWGRVPGLGKPEPVVEEPVYMDDWDQCSYDQDYYMKPILETLKCAALTVAGEVIEDPKIKTIIRLLIRKARPQRPIQGWALKMIDASFKPPPGLTAGKLHWPGDMEMCNAISANYSTDEGFRDLQGSYCRVHVGPKAENSSLSLALGVCVPSTCTTQNITGFINTGDVTFSLLDKAGLEVKSIWCGRELDMATDTRGQMALGITLGLAVIAIVAAIYDGMIRKALIQKRLDKNAVPVQSLHQNSLPGKSGSGPAPAPVDRSGSVNYVTAHPEDIRRYSLSNNVTVHDFTSPKPQGPSVPQGPQVSVSPGPQIKVDMVPENCHMSYKLYLDEPASIMDRVEVAFVGFSALNSMKNMFMPRLRREYFRSADAIRFMSFCYAILGMTYILGIIYTETFTTGNLIFKLMELRKLLYFQPVINLTLCTDSFLVLSGFFVTYNWLKRVAANGGKMTFGMVAHFYIHRYWSLMPAFMMVTMFYTCLYEYFTTGPMVPPLITDAENCRENWWTNLLMVNNLVNTNAACMSWTWYIPMLFQLHIITPIILIPLVFSFFAGAMVLIVLFAINITVTAMVSIKLYENFGFDEWYYDFVMVPWTKAGAYFVGVALGVLIFKSKDRKIKIPAILSVIGWLASIVVVTVVATSTWKVFGAELEEGQNFNLEDFKFSKLEAVSLRTLGHIAWGLCIGWMIFASETGHGGYLRSFLRWKAFGPLSRITFMAFLVSAIMIIRNTLVQVSLIYVTLNNMLYFLIGNITISMIVGLALGLVFQHPFIGLEKAFLIKTKRDAYIIASNPITDEEEEDETSSTAVTPPTPPSPRAQNMYDNLAYIPNPDTPPPAYKLTIEEKHIETTEL